MLLFSKVMRLPLGNIEQKLAILDLINVKSYAVENFEKRQIG